MGFLGALYLGLFVWCLRRNVDKKEALYRFITLTSGAIVNVGIAAIISALGTTPEDKEGAWVVIPIYFIVFGWRIVLDIISYSKKRSTPQIRKQPKSTNNISKLCSMGMMVGCAGVALFLGIVLVSLIIYGRVYLFDGYDYTKVLVVLSLICMFIGICSLVGKACTTSKTTQQSSSNDDETVRKILLYKDLLDRGAITAEEYEEKKRQILGLPVYTPEQVTVFSSIITEAWKQKFIEINPIGKKYIHYPKIVQPQLEAYSDDEVEDLMEALENEDIRTRALLTLAVTTGMRRGELVGLMWDDIDLLNS